MKLKTHQPSPDSSAVKFERKYVRPNPGRTLIVGSQVTQDKEDRRLRYADVVGVDMQAATGVDVVLDLEDDVSSLGLFDHIECTSVLEHSKRPWLMAANLEKLMNPGATIFVSVPFIWRLHSYPDDFWRLTPNAVRSIFPTIHWTQLMLASEVLSESPKVSSMSKDNHPYLSRTETVGFGVKA